MAQALAVQKAVLVLQERILLDKIDCSSVYKLLSETWAIVSANGHLDDAGKRDVFKEALARVGAGLDGVPGTPDDLIPPDLVKKLAALIDGGMMDEVLDVVEGPVRAACGCLAGLRRGVPAPHAGGLRPRDCGASPLGPSARVANTDGCLAWLTGKAKTAPA